MEEFPQSVFGEELPEANPAPGMDSKTIQRRLLDWAYSSTALEQTSTSECGLCKSVYNSSCELFFRYTGSTRLLMRALAEHAEVIRDVLFSEFATTAQSITARLWRWEELDADPESEKSVSGLGTMCDVRSDAFFNKLASELRIQPQKDNKHANRKYKCKQCDFQSQRGRCMSFY